MKLTVITATSKTSSVEVSDAVFGQKANPTLLAQAVRVYLSNLRQGSSKVKTRSEVNRTRAKMYRQKGTGGARHGARSAPIFVGGGVAHGPNGQQNWTKSLSRKMKAQALRVALSTQADKIVVTENLNGLKGKTAEAAKLLTKMLGDLNKTLVVLGENSELMFRSLRNMETVLPVQATNLTALQVASADKIVFTKDSLTLLETRLAPATKEKKASAKKVSPLVAPKKAAAPKAVKKTTKPTAKKTTKAKKAK